MGQRTEIDSNQKNSILPHFDTSVFGVAAFAVMVSDVGSWNLRIKHFRSRRRCVFGIDFGLIYVICVVDSLRFSYYDFISCFKVPHVEINLLTQSTIMASNRADINFRIGQSSRIRNTDQHFAPHKKQCQYFCPCSSVWVIPPRVSGSTLGTTLG